VKPPSPRQILDRSTLSEQPGKFNSETGPRGSSKTPFVMCQSGDDRYRKKCGRCQSHENPISPKSEGQISRLDLGWPALTHYNMRISMRSRFQITVSNRQVPGTPVQRSGFWSRIKRFWAGVALATLAVGVLIAALILGSVIAVLLAILLIIGVAIVVVRAALLRSKQA
jgi:hypothetical protein